jgi:hypothetical protein
MRPITVRFIWRDQAEGQMEAKHTAEQFTIPASGTHGWHREDDLPFSVNQIEFEIPNYEGYIEQARREGRWELLDELRDLGAEAMKEKMAEIYYSEDYYD